MIKILKLSSEHRIKLITEENYKKAFAILAIPAFIMGIITNILPIIDGLIIYNYDSETSGAAISFVSSMQNVFLMGIVGLAQASSAIVGQTLGTSDIKAAKKYAGQVFTLSTVITICSIPFFILLTLFITRNYDQNLQESIYSYSKCIVLSMPLIVLQSTYNSVKSVYGEIEKTFVRTILFVPIKIFCSCFFIIYLDLSILGAGLAVFTAYFITSIFILYDLFFSTENRFKLSDFKLDFEVVKLFFRNGTPAIAQGSLKSLGFLISKMEAAYFGTAALTAQSIAGDITGMFQATACCYNTAIIPLISVNVGNQNPERAKQIADFVVKLLAIIGLIFAIIAFIFAPQFVALYTDDPYIATLAVGGVRIYAIGIVGFVLMFNEMPVFIALGKNKISLIIQMIRIWGVRFFMFRLLIVMNPELNVYASFIALTTANIVCGILSHHYFKKCDYSKNINIR